MLNTDIQGNALSGADATGAVAFSGAVRQFSIYAGDPLAAADALISEQPRFVMAHALKAWLYLLGTDARAAAAAREIVAATDGLEATRREQGHLAAIKHLVDGRFHAASQAIEDVSAENPHDLLALIAGHQLDFFTGNSRMLRDRISRARPHWNVSQPGYHAVLGMHAFGLEEMGDYARAEASGREALEHERCDGWARHAVAHVLEMQGRPDEGIAFMRGDVKAGRRAVSSLFTTGGIWRSIIWSWDRSMRCLNSSMAPSPRGPGPDDRSH